MVIYKIENLINGKIYVGRTIKTLNHRLAQHKCNKKSLIGKAIREYGWENFKAEVIEECNSFEELVEREIYWINKLNCKTPNGYNIADGGFGFIPNKEYHSDENIYEHIEDYLSVLKYVMKMIRGKWKMRIILCLIKEDGCQLRRYELMRKLKDITNFMLTKSLRELERDGLVNRIVIKENPPKEIAYSLTEDCLSLILAMNELYDWGYNHMQTFSAQLTVD